MGSKKYRVRSAVAALGALVTCMLSLPSAVVHAQVAGVTFRLDTIDSRLAGGSWALKNEAITLGGLLTWTNLASGLLPTPGGALSVSIPVQSIQALDPTKPLGSEVFMLEMLAPVDASHAILGNGLEVRPSSEVTAGTIVTFHPVVGEVPTYASPEAATAAASCSTCQPSQDPGNLPATDASGRQIFNPQPAQSSNAPPASRPPTLGGVSVATTGAIYVWKNGAAGGPGDNINPPLLWGPAAGDPLAPTETAVKQKVPASPPCLPTNCAVSASATAQPVGQCNSYAQGSASHYDCVKSAYNFGVESARGWANKTMGMVDTFKEEYSNTQAWDNGYRSQTGPFSINGSSHLQFTQQQELTWDTDGDCWAANQPAGTQPQTNDSPPPCGYEGWWSTWGNDTWRWEKHEDTICGGIYDVQCQTVTFETLFDYVNNGGNQYNPNNGMNGDLEQPSNVHTGGDPYGNWVEYDPSSNTSVLGWDNSATYQGGASIDVSWPEAYSTENFSSSMTDSTSNKITNTYTFRGPNQGLPWGGHYWSYDGSTDQSGWAPWAWRFWTCSFNNAYWGALDSYAAGGDQTACWDYTLS